MDPSNTAGSRAIRTTANKHTSFGRLRATVVVLALLAVAAAIVVVATVEMPQAGALLLQPNGPRWMVNDITLGPQDSANVAVDVTGAFSIGFDSVNGSGLDVWTRRYDSSAFADGIEFRVNLSIAGDQKITDMAQLFFDGASYELYHFETPDDDGTGISFGGTSRNENQRRVSAIQDLAERRRRDRARLWRPISLSPTPCSERFSTAGPD